MKKLLIFVLSVYLLFPIFVYNIKDVSRVHVMKFSGSFDIVYQDVKQFSDDLTVIQKIVFDNDFHLNNPNFSDELKTFKKNSYHSNVSYLAYSPRAPPIII